MADLKQEKSKWTYSALFWVLNDLSKKALGSNDMDTAKKIRFNDGRNPPQHR